MSLPLVINPTAEADLDEAKTWYNQQRAGLGDEFLDCDDEALDQIGQWPKLSRKVFLDLRRNLSPGFRTASSSESTTTR